MEATIYEAVIQKWHNGQPVLPSPSFKNCPGEHFSFPGILVDTLPPFENRSK